MTPEFAETLALKALAWLMGNDELLPVFMGSTGAQAEGLAEAASDPAFLASVLTFLTMDDAWVMEFCDAAGVAYDQPLMALHALPGNQMPHWT